MLRFLDAGLVSCELPSPTIWTTKYLLLLKGERQVERGRERKEGGREEGTKEGKGEMGKEREGWREMK